MPIFATLPGRVTQTQDGYPDRDTDCRSSDANWVIVDHGGRQVGIYIHMRTGSVRVAPGDRVEAGQELGLIGSSGCSSWPHLHFESQLGRDAVDPHADRG